MNSRCLNTGNMIHKAVIAFVCLLIFIPVYVNAATETADVKPDGLAGTSAMYSAGAEPVNAGRMTQLAAGLFIVLLCIIALGWIARRFNRLQATPDGCLRVLGGLSMGSRERVVLVQVGARQLLLGVAPGRINTLHVLEEPLESVSELSAGAAGSGFAEKLSAALSRHHPRHKSQ